MTDTQIVLLRGINVGGHRKVAMPELRSALADVGLSNPRTYIQTGNVVLDDAPPADELTVLFRNVLRAVFGLDDVAIMVRSQASVAHALEASERLFPDDGREMHAKLTHVMFMHAKPAPARRAALDPEVFAPDRFHLDLHGSEADLHVSYANGVSGSKLLVDRVERGFGVSATARNVNTVRRLTTM